MQHYQIHIQGKVQGVWFRKSTRREAMRLGITGFVRNEKNSSVYVEASGSEAAMVEFIDWLKLGPPLARVTGISAVPFTPETAFHGFQVTY